jgi:CheY-like chemotaxis protein
MADTVAKRVLVIEDEKFLSNILKLKLEREGFSVIQAFDGEEGLQIMKEQKPDLVVLDLVMPRMSGFEVLERVSMDPQLGGTPIVVASNLGQESDMQKAQNFGVRGYFVKAQTSVDDLVAMFKQALGQPGS